MRAIVCLFGSFMVAASAQAQTFSSYTLTPVSGGFNGASPTGTPQQSDLVLLNRLMPGGTFSTTGLSLSSFASATDIQNANARIDQAFQQINNNNALLANTSSNSLLERGIAATITIPGAFMPSAPGKTSWAVNGSVFQSQFGAGISLAHRLSFSTPLAMTVAYGTGGGTAHVGRFGLMGEF
jgi:hypothetical protein